MSKHILRADQFTRPRLEKIFQQAERIENMYRQNPLNCLALLGSKKIRGVLNFFEPSTRTHMSFKKVFSRLGIELVYDTTSANISSSAAKGESIENAFHNMYKINDPDIIDIVVLRHPEDDAAERAAVIADMYNSIIINAGTGKREHPTQMLLDLYTIFQKRHGQIDGTKIVVGGDPFASRTIHSLVIGLAQNYKIKQIGVCGPTGCSLPDDVLAQIKDHCEIINFATYTQAVEWQPNFLYITRPQLERYIPLGCLASEKAKKIAELVEKFNFLQIDDKLAQRMKEIGCYYMHPQPVDSKNFNEILPHLIDHENSLLLQQSNNGVWTRMAAIIDIFS